MAAHPRIAGPDTGTRMSARPPLDVTPRRTAIGSLSGWWRRWRAMARHRFLIDGIEHFNIRWRFRLVVVALGLAFLGHILWSATEQAKIEKAHVRDRALSLAQLMTARLDDHVLQVDRILAIASHSVGGSVGDPAAVRGLLENMRPYVPSSVNNIVAWTMSGDAIAALERNNEMVRRNVADRRYFQEAISKRTLAIEAPIVSKTNGEVVAQFARPMFDRDNQLVGVITMSMRLRALGDDLNFDNRVSKDKLLAILDRDGYILARTLDPDLWVGKQIPNRAGIAPAFAAKQGVRDITHVDGSLRLTGFSVATRVPWLVITGEAVEQATAPVSEGLLKDLAIGLGILTLAMLLAGRVAAWTIDPLMRLAADTERLGAGDLAHRSTVVTGGEIATLAANFNRMAAALQERELALAASQRQVREIANHIPAMVTLVDRDERYRFVNRYVGRIMTTTPAEMLGKTVREVRGEDFYRKAAPHMARAFGGEATVMELSGEINGRTVHFRTDYVPAREASGEISGIYAFTQDITERKAAELQLAESQKRLVTITDNLPAMISYVDDTRRFRFANRAFEKWFHKPLSRIIGQPFTDLMDAGIASQYEHYFERGMKGEICTYEIEVPISGDRTRWLRAMFIPDVDEAECKVKGVYGMVHDVTEAKIAEQRLTRLAQFDTLTGLPNRHQFNEKLASALVQADLDGTPLALMFLDIDHFKLVNDRYGHGGGDALLKDFAQRLVECVRPTDAVARLAGDEFVILLEGLHSDDEPQFIARKIIAAVERPFHIDDSYLQVTASIGIAMRVFETDASMLMKRADEALYEAKRAGRNTFRLAS